MGDEMTSMEEQSNGDSEEINQQPTRWLVNLRGLFAVLKDFAIILSLVAMPVLLWNFQSATQEGIASQQSSVQEGIAKRDASRQYVQLAVEILREAPPSQADDRKQLREWAVKIINHNAPIPLTEGAKTELIQQGVPGWQPTGWVPEGHIPEGHVPMSFDPKAFSPGSFSPGSFAMGLRRLTEKECRERYQGPELDDCLRVARETK